jgi:hypothetical protein
MKSNFYPPENSNRSVSFFTEQGASKEEEKRESIERKSLKREVQNEGGAQRKERKTSLFRGQQEIFKKGPEIKEEKLIFKRKPHHKKRGGKNRNLYAELPSIQEELEAQQTLFVPTQQRSKKEEQGNINNQKCFSKKVIYSHT